jgi:nucleoside-diphosphate-sugar epimerase
VSNKTLIIGGCGYIGSHLYNYFLNKDLNAETVDLELFGNYVNPKNKKVNYNTLTRRYLKKYQNIILLAGYSSVKMCEGKMHEAFNNNVVNFINLLDNIEDQKFIYASSSSVYGDTKNSYVNETYDRYVPSTFYDLSKKEIDYYTHLSSKNVYGLRFGTVNGFSPNLRVDLMINKMYKTAIEKGRINVSNPDFLDPF